jgi:DNA-binding LacI/PurR family transcriptional regulator
LAAVTIRDVARQAGVGIGTVSRVLNDSPAVSEETRQKVLLTIRELDFTPSQIARRLSRGKTMTVAVIAPFFTRRSYIERLQGIDQVLSSSGYDLVLFNVETVGRRDECLRTVPRQERFDGVLILTFAPNDEEADRLAMNLVPTVLVDAFHPRLGSVYIDNIAGGMLAVNHLLGLGHRRIAYVGEDLSDNPFNFRSMRDRFEGYRRALEAAGIPFRPDYHKQGKYGWREGRRLAEELLTLDKRPTAVFAYSDTMAFGVLESAQRLGLRVPEDLSVIGFDDVELAQYFRLTTIRQPLYESGARGAALLLEQMDSDNVPAAQHATLPTDLVIRQTTAAVEQPAEA